MEQAFLATLHFEGELGDRGVGNVFEGGPQAAALGRVDAAGEDDVDLAAQVGDQIRQLVGRAAQVDRAFDRVVEQRRDRAGEAVDRGGGALPGGELDPGADVPMWALSRSSDFGRATAARAMFESPSGMVRTAFSAGWPSRWCRP